ncbi:MAG: rRNA small subunit methyltransferase 1 [Actinobacteria bacterium]|nr:rRNA small subunit methyltransferase 1 [Actinomycetota bacterium]
MKIVKTPVFNKQVQNRGTLYICATPIGNLGDVSFRLLDTLKAVDIILAEDTRTIRKLLSRYKISKPTSSIIGYQDYTNLSKVENVYRMLEEGKNIALVSESGMPAIQDPGYKIISNLINRETESESKSKFDSASYSAGKNIKISVIPGPNATISALVLSGLPADSFLFVGFLSKTAAKRNSKIGELSTLPYTLIFYESPLRITRLLEELLKKFGERKACLVREITKIYEEEIRGNLSSIIERIKIKPVKGEIVLVVEGSKNEPVEKYSENEIKNMLEYFIGKGMTKKEAVKAVKSLYDIDRHILYDISTKIRK